MSACLLLQLILPMLLQAFGTIGPVETAYFRETGKQVLLSEQDLMDCGWYLNNKACFGGYQVTWRLRVPHHPSCVANQ